MWEEVQNKANMSDVNTLFDAKAGVEEVNQVLEEVTKELNGKASAGEIPRIEDRIRSSSLCSGGEAAIGRWVWKSGKTKSGSIPWNLQAVNTDASVFIWERNKVGGLFLESRPVLFG